MNEERRQFLKIILIGSASLIAGKVLGPVLSGLLGDQFVGPKPERQKKNLTTTVASAFKIVENQKMLTVFDSQGEEIFQIDKSA